MKFQTALCRQAILLLLTGMFANPFYALASNSKNDPVKIDGIMDFFDDLLSDIRKKEKPEDVVSSAYDCLPPVSLATIRAVNNGDWDTPNTWQGGTIPTAQDDVIIDTGVTVNLVSSCLAKSITVNGILKNKNNADFQLTTQQVMIMGQSAELRIGTAMSPYLGSGKITLIGNDPGTDNGEGMGTKLIGIMDAGTLSLHGAEVLTWTKLDQDAVVGNSQITLSQAAATWKVGDEIVIAPSGFRVSETEKAIIKSISGDNKRITLEKPLAYDHRGSIVTYENNKSIDVRAEVGLLSRNLIIEARDDAAAGNGFGGHIMCMPGAFMYVSGVELHRMGQKGKLGRYPIHWHKMGNVDGQYVKNSSIHRSFNRAVTIHQTNEVLIENNVAYDFIGHGFFLEDGNEERNIFRKNFGVYAKVPEQGYRIEPFDNTVSVFWIAHPFNTFEDNAVGGSERNGYWFVPDVGESNARLQKFENNSVHSCRDGVAMDRSLRNKELVVARWNPKNNGERMSIPIEGVTAYHCERGFWSKLTSGGVKTLNNSVLGGNQENAFVSFTGEVKNTTIIGKIKGFNYDQMAGAPNYYLGAQLYNGSCDFENVYLAGFEDANTNAIGTRRASAKYPNFTMKNMMFDSTVPLSKRLDFNRPGGLTDPSRSYTYSTGIIDLDGSISGIVGGRITPRIVSRRNGSGIYKNKVYDEGFNIVPGSKLNDDWGVYVTEGVDYGYIPVIIRNNPINEKNSEVFYLHRSDGRSTFDVPRTGVSAQIPAIINSDKYHYRVQPEINCEYYLTNLRWVRENSSAFLTIVNVPSNYKFSGRRVNSMAQLEAATVSSYYFESNELRIKHVATKRDNGTNSSFYYDDWSGNTVKADRPGSDLGKYLTLADFETKESRFKLKNAGSGGLSVPSLNFSSDGSFPVTDSNDDFLSYDYTTDGDGKDEYLDLEMSFEKQIWDLYLGLSVKYDGPPVQIYAKGEGVSTFLGMYRPVNGNINVDLSITDENNDWRENITGLVFRVHESALSNNLNSTVTEEIKIYDILLHNVALSEGDLVQTNNVAPNVSITSPDHLGTYAVGEEITINAAATDPDGNLDSVEFKINDTFLSSDGSRPFNGSFTPTQPGMYTIAAKASDTEGQQIEVSVTIMVDSTTLDITGFEEPNQKLMLFPNPSKDGILQLSRSVDYWKVYTINGQIISEGTDDKIDLSQVDKGVYFLKVSNGESIKIVLN